ncbi:DinB family protein [Hymenobacter sp. HMF4947]|uniref:DinB family protein n=1 Tax=Hymenobacter ginkgonis TaxID=2682976 RepID=A0A7K1T9K4_9BACT|nr:DinB family protein [Hymenobacter ginkgonis]MVN75078.1 DinB family protein [Hymenobacter ginkgonis]
MDQPTRTALVAELTQLLAGGNAHATFEQACADLPAPLRNQAVPEVPYTIWQLVEHVRIAQWDIVEFCLNPAHKSPKWPDGYWSKSAVDEAGWQATLAQIAHDQQRFIQLLEAPTTDLFAPLPHGDGQNIFREALLIGDHAAYHTGEIILVRRLLHAWH